MDLELRYRKNFNGVKCVAPFINGWNVWHIPVNEWTEAVQRAVLHAYELGAMHHAAEIAEIRPASCPLDGWSRARLVREGE